MSEDWKTAVCVTAADYNGHDWDGSPFRYEGEFPHWLKGAMGSNIKPIGGERDYAVWAVLTDDYGQPRWIARPGDWIVCIGGSLAVLSEPAYQAFRAGYLAQAETVERLKVALAWYADPISYAVTQIKEPRSAAHADDGRRARQPLADLQPKETK